MQFAYPQDNRPLHNPLPQEIETAGVTEREQSAQTDPDQLTFDLQTENYGIKDWIHNLRHKATRREAELELIPYWRHFSSNFATVSAICTVLFLLISGLTGFSRMPPRVPFYYNSVEARWEQADKIVILMLPVALGVVNAILLRLIYDIYAYDKRLSIMLSWLLTLTNLLVIIASGQIFSLIL